MSEQDHTRPRNSVTFEQAFGNPPDPAPEMALAQIRALYGESMDPAQGQLCIQQFPAGVSRFLPPGQFMAMLQDDGMELLRLLIFGASHDPRLPRGKADSAEVSDWQNVYVGVALAHERLPWFKRGGKKNVMGSWAFWMDLDVKKGALESAGEVDAVVQWLDSVTLGPDMVIRSGGGGAHLYWFAGRLLDTPEIEELGHRMALLIESQFGIEVDRCWNADRILRLAGTLWVGTAGETRAVTLERSRPGVTDLGKVRMLTDPVWAAEQDRSRRERTADVGRWRKAGEALVGISDELIDAGLVSARHGWDAIWMRTMAEAAFNSDTEWERILEPAGWTKHGEPDREGRQVWTRPGGDVSNPRSAVVDWEESPDVMSLLSRSADSGLRRLADSGIPLTKARVAAELHHQGDVAALLVGFLRGKASAEVPHA